MSAFIFGYGAAIVPINSVSAVTEGASTPVSNVTSRDRPYRVYRGTGAHTNEILTIDFGAAQNVGGVFLDNINVSLVTIQGNATDSWGSPSFTVGGVPAYNYASGRTKLASVTPTFNYRYMRIVSGGSSTDGTDTLAIGGVTIFDTVATWVENTGFPYREKAKKEALITVLPGGSIDKTTLGDRYAEITLASALNSSAIDSDMRAFLDAAAGGELVWFYRNNSDPSEAYLCQKLIDTDFEWVGANTRTFTPLVLREVV